MIRRPPRSPLFPSTPLFRSQPGRGIDANHGAVEVRKETMLDDDVAPAGVDGVAEGGLSGGAQRQILDRHLMRRLRSEEHTSELQSQSNLVCRLLLDKKNTTP